MPSFFCPVVMTYFSLTEDAGVVCVFHSGADVLLRNRTLWFLGVACRCSQCAASRKALLAEMQLEHAAARHLKVAEPVLRVVVSASAAEHGLYMCIARGHGVSDTQSRQSSRN